jgi:glycerol-3-phosphate dehydrogenase
LIGKVSIIGAGSLGTAIAQLVSNNAKLVYLHAKRKEVVQESRTPTETCNTS